MTLPIKNWHPVLAKFFAGWMMLCISLFLTFPLISTIFYLGSPDIGSLITGYLGAILMAGAFLAVSCVASVVSKSQSVSFILSTIFIFVLLVLGWGVFSELLSALLPVYLVDFITDLGAISHYEALGRGVIDFRDVLYFVLIIATGLLLNINLLTASRSSRRDQLQGFVTNLTLYKQTILTFVAIGSLFILTDKLALRLDLTETKAFSLTEGSHAIAEKVEAGTKATFYFSKSLANMPPFVKQFANRVEDILYLYQKSSGGRLAVEVVTPKPDSEEEDDAERYGISSVSTKDGPMYLGLSIVNGDKEASVSFLDPSREEILEYQISEALVKIKEEKKPVLGVYSDLKLTHDKSAFLEASSKNKWYIFNHIGKSYDIRILDLKEPVPKEISLLLVIHPKTTDQDKLYHLDQYVLSGRRLMVAIDAFSRTQMIQEFGSPTITPGGKMPNASSYLGKLFASWGIQFDPTQVVGDANRAAAVGGGENQSPVVYPMYTSLGKDDFGASPITGRLRQVLLAEGGALALDPAKKVTMQPLLTTSQEAGLVQSLLLGYQSPKVTASKFKAGTTQLVQAAVFRGQFSTAFPEKALDPLAVGFIPKAQAENEIVVVADVDFMTDTHAVQKNRYGEQVVRSEKNDNLNFVLNSLDYLRGSSDLMAIRASGSISRPFSTLINLQKDTEKKWREKEKKIRSEIRAFEDKLAGFYSVEKRQNQLSLRLEDLKTIKSLREKERLAETSFQNIRKNLREEIEVIGHVIIAGNLVTSPTITILFALGFFYRRSQKSPQKFKISLFYPKIAAVLLLFLGALTFWAGQHTKVSLAAKAPAKTLFKMEDLALVKKVTIESKGAKVTIVKDSRNQWRLLESQQQIVNADRLSRLLYDFSEAKIMRTIQNPRPSHMELDKGNSIRLEGDNGFDLHFLLGSRRQGGGGFIQRVGEKKAYVTSHSMLLKTHPGFWLGGL